MTDRPVDPLTLPERRVAAGEGIVNLAVDIPAGWTIDETAPFRIAYRSANTEIVRLIPKVAEQSFHGPAFPISIPATFAVGRTTVEIELECRVVTGGERRPSGVVKVVIPVEVTREEAEKNLAAMISLEV